MKQVNILSVAPRTTTQVDSLVANNIRMMLKIMEQAAPLAPDFIIFPEIALQAGLPMREAIRLAEPVPGSSIEQVCRQARALSMNVIWPLLERDGDHIYNTAALIGRDGSLIGRYRKFQPTRNEMNDGIQPGVDVPVFQTDCGQVGLAICFDVSVPEIARSLARQQARLVFWPSMFDGGRLLQTWAQDYGFAMVSCSAVPLIPGGAYTGVAIVDSTGTVVADHRKPCPLPSNNDLLAVTFATLNLDRKTYHLDDNQHKLKAIQSKYGKDVSLFFHHPEGTFVLQSNLEGLDIESIEREFELVDLRAYLDRSIQQRAELIHTEILSCSLTSEGVNQV